MNYELIEQKIKTPLKPIEQILTNRGIGLAEVKEYLQTTDEDILDYNLIDNLREGAIILFQTIQAQDDILIQIDSDCDGYCSAAILINYLNRLCPGYTQNHIIYRIHDDKSHGININNIPETVKLVIAPDSSSNEEEIHKQLQEKGIKVLVIDHHEAESISNYACVINNQLCNYPNKTLSGAGMVYKFCCYLDSLTEEQYADMFLDLTSLALIGDMMDIRSLETKHLIVKGLNSVQNPFFDAMTKKQSFSISKNGGLNPFTISWYIAPLINAITRTGTHNEKILIFESMIEFKAYEQILSDKRGAKKGSTETRVEQAVRVCQRVKNRQEEIKEKNLAIIEKIIEKFDLLNKHKVLLIRLDKEHSIDANLTGLIANQIASKYQRPTLLLNEKIDVNGEIYWSGSGRNYQFSPIDSFKDFLNDTGLMIFAEGHASAFGAAIKDSDIQSFIAITDILLAQTDFIKKYLVDFIYQGDSIDKKTVLAIGSAEGLWGQNLPKPYIAIENVLLKETDLKLLGEKKNTLKITLPGDIEMISFQWNETKFEEFKTLTKTNRFTFIAECKINEWLGNIKPQLSLVDYETSFFF